MYHDLCLPYTTSQSDFPRTLSFLVELSYSVAAISLPLPSGLSSNKQPPKIPDLPPPPPGLKPLLTRLTFPISTSSDLPNAKLQALQQSYDLVALRPTSEKTLLLATSALEVDLISLDLSARWPFHFRPKMFSAAVKRGIWFEICYSAAVDSAVGGPARQSGGFGELVPATDVATARRNLISNGTSLIRALRGGKNVIFSSDAKTVLGLRAPMDVVNFGVLLGLSAEKGLEAVRDGPSLVVRAAKARRGGWRGVLLAVQIKQNAKKELEQETERGAKRKITDIEDDESRKNAPSDAVSAAGKRDVKLPQPSNISSEKVSRRQRKKLAKTEKQDKDGEAVDVG